MADKVIPIVGGEIVVKKGIGAWPVELEIRDLDEQRSIEAQLTRRDAVALRIAVAELLSDDTLERGRG